MEPIILADVKNDMAVAQNENFAPVAVLIPVNSEQEAIQVANATPFGLSRLFILEFTTVKWVSVQKEPRQYPFS
ncbi:acyl-CoA reductase-like NAD-dependent aldehyde dehydrogenase [Peribacillus huizhouensis]|uniref:Acyl-CoA reductase-like NAD-dependent aldehyde dehydrogenase n=2 Tax=Peribacillus huizhouensis TaxID=1501239 RepID=A0ABR6CTP0_9BACI|nr:acyl-CoA reductase-like NAD-dependent aldehyde dehydrogenase [Peribacillus huizhouensis]